MKAIFVSGTPLMRDYTPGSAVDAGDVVVIENRPYVAHLDIAAGELGALAAGGGVYDLIKDGTSGPDVSDGEEAYWITADELATNVAEDNPHFGAFVGDAGTNVAVARALHSPNGIIVNESS